ncbi:MAG: S8 family serine peptidase [Flavobacteriales bacterium]|nr:S8 family serine peptidase [Flavobacteriales bacterium]
MKRTFIALCLLVSGMLTFAQTATLTNSLNDQLIAASNKDYLKVNIVLADQVDHISLNQELKDRHVSLDERAKTVIRKSMQLANNTQSGIIHFLNQNTNKVKSYQSLWVINMMTIEARKDIILQLAFMPEIDYIELYDHFTGKPIDIMESKGTVTKAVGAAEPGLISINAHKLWAMGYTGKARKLYNIDTGVWKDHPALTDNWLGNYQPLSQAWNGIDSPIPVDKNGSHGTHTAGTVLGLDPLTSDTIGVAFNAYFMVADPIVTNLNDIKPLPEYIDVFQFALNPDGDTNTTNDIPDVINNSWGIAEHLDTSICAGYVTQMFDAIEAAGIANVFSAGNEGSNDTTIGKPQYVSTGLVNTFTVGALNAQSAGNPIAGFSSRGPTVCPVTGSLSIKPEVAAPGVNVRSSVDQNNYANYQGTSMAGPHASGAVLLLKEAFPNATGEEILLALYYSAVDLGIPGEDNTYGMGMIDVKAAFDSLALTYTPAPPTQFKYDLTISKILSPTETIRCDNMISPKILLKNLGDSTITSANITYRLNNEPTQSFAWSGNLVSGDTTSVNLPSITAQSTGDYELIVKADIDTAKTECDYINNQRVFRFNIRDLHTTLPYKEDFELMRIDSSEWLILNPDGITTWDTAMTAGLPWGAHSATVQMYDYTGSGQLDDLISTRISLPNDDSLFVRFDLAYNMIHQVIADTLMVYISSDCGNNFDLIYKVGGDSLETQDTISPQFVPAFFHEWRTEHIDITAYANNDVILKFETYNKSGNNIYLDNIWVYEGIEPLTVQEHHLEQLSIFPNPATNQLTINTGNNNLENASIALYDLMGKQLLSRVVTQQQQTIDLSTLSHGVYLLKFMNNKGSVAHKIIKQ